MLNFKIFIENYIQLSDVDWQKIELHFEKKIFKKNELILEPGSVCNHFYFLETGLLRFFYDVDGEDITKTFTLAPYCFTSKLSFRNQIPSNEGIQALEDTTVWQTSFQQYKRLEDIVAWNIFIRKLLNEIQEFSENFYLEAKIMTAEARYQKLFGEYPASLMQKIPLKHLSSFLGIAPQSLSRIRKKTFGRKS